MPEFLVGLDLGQSQDYTALCVAERVDVPTGKPHYHLRHLERFRLGTSYPAVVERVGEMLAGPPLWGCSQLVVDGTGVGAPVVDMFRQKGLVPIAITITGGDTVTGDGGNYRVPKRYLVSTMQVLLQAGLLKEAEELPDATVLVRELLNFRVKIDPLTAHDSYGAWREGQHDDLVLATAVACWYGERQPGYGVW